MVANARTLCHTVSLYIHTSHNPNTSLVRVVTTIYAI